MTKSQWETKAKKKWGKKAAWIHGDGQFALLAPCRVLTVTLWPTLEEATKEKERIDQGACGGQCNPARHSIVDMSK
jgi:hypothetical protein